MLYRATTADDLGPALSVATAEPTGPIGHVLPQVYRDGLARGQYRPEWTWLAVEGHRVVGRAIWTAEPGQEFPQLLECLTVDPRVAHRVTVGQQLVAAGHAGFRDAGAAMIPGYEQHLAPDARADPATAAALAWRELAVRRAGLTDRVERHTLQWTTGTPPATPSEDLCVEAEPDDDVILDGLQWIAVGSLDVATRRALAELDPEKQARADLDFFYQGAGSRGWWRVAWTWHGRMVGVAIPSALPDGTRTIGYLGVLPEFRGRGYVDDLLAEVTAFHAAAGARRVLASTETANAPMLAALRRAGYRTTGLRVILSAPTG